MGSAGRMCVFVSGGWSFMVGWLLAMCSHCPSCVGGGFHLSLAPCVVSGTADIGYGQCRYLLMVAGCCE